MTSAAVGALWAAHACAASAQAPTAPSAAASPSFGDEALVQEVIVTAQRREQAAQDVGIALSVLSGEQLAVRGITNVNQLQSVTPNLEVEPAFGGGAAQFRVRGVGFQDYATNNAPTVGVYVNEVAYPFPVMTQGLIFDVDRVEVLRGPQGTLYGRNTTGGAINVVTRRPTAAVSAGALVEYGRFDHLRAEGFVSGPLAPRVQGRLAASTEQGGAWQYNRRTGKEIGAADRLALRGLLSVHVNDATTLLLDVHGGRDRSENQALYLFNPLRTRGGAGPTIPADTDRAATDWRISPRFAADIGRGPDAKPGRDNTSWGTSLNLQLDRGPVRLTSITSYEALDRSEYGDWDASFSVEADTFFGSEVAVLSQELRLASADGGRLSWVAGLYASRQTLDEKYYSDFIDIFATFGRVDYRQEVESLSLFGQAEYRLTPQINLIAGLRYEEEERRLEGFGTAFGGATALPPTSVETKMTPLTGKAALEYRPRESVLFYGSVSRGAKSGGFTTYNTGQSSSIQPFAPEILLAYEVGFKADPTRALQVNGAAYLYDYSDQQVLSAVYGPNGPVGRFANAPKSRIQGVELEGRWRPFSSLLITQYLSYKSGEYETFFDLDVPASRAAGRAVFVDRAGQAIPFPAWSYGGAVRYDWSVDAHRLTADLNYSYRDDYPSWLGSTYDVDSYWLVDASLTVSPDAGPWSLSFWGRNMLDQEYDLTRNFFTSADIAQPGRPRTVGIRVNYEY